MNIYTVIDKFEKLLSYCETEEDVDKNINIMVEAIKWQGIARKARLKNKAKK